MAVRKSEAVLAGEALVFISGPLKLQNELLAKYLASETGLECQCGYVKEHKEVLADSDKNRSNLLILWDCLHIGPSDIWEDLGAGDSALVDSARAALFNVHPNRGVEKEAVARGVRGIFFEQDPLDMFIKGVTSMLKGELWFSRDTLVKCLVQTGDSSPQQQEPATTLTPRETEILFMISAGASNDQIADNLSISPHTVRTHIYNIYQKIDVPNRLQAALWAAKHL